MLEHGDFRIERDGKIIHIYPVGSFNEFGVNAVFAAIKEMAPVDTNWALIEHPKNDAGLTPEATEALINNYHALSQLGCKAVGLEVNALWTSVLSKLLNDRLDIPVYFYQDPQALERKILSDLEKK